MLISSNPCVPLSPQSVCVGNFKLIPIQMSKEFLRAVLHHSPETKNQKELYGRIKSLVQSPFHSDFYLPSITPTCDRYTIHFDASLPTNDQRLKCWFEAAKQPVLDGWKNKLINADEYIGFLANFIGKIVKCGQSLEWAWSIVADDHRPLKEFLQSDHLNQLPPRFLEELNIFYRIATSSKFVAHSLYHDYSILTLHCKDCLKEGSPVSLYRALGEHNNPCKSENDVLPGTYALLAFTKT